MALFTSQIYALHIRDISISQISPNSINVSVNTEAVELYYFHSAQYTISGSTITIEACYVSGFGSTIEFLNNNFEIPIDTLQTANYTLTVKIYYTDLEVLFHEQNLEDEKTGLFSTPFSGTVVLNDRMLEKPPLILFPNPVKDYLSFSEKVIGVFLYDITGRIVKKFTEINNCIDLSDLQSGTYFIEFQNKQNRIFRRIIVKK